jgi:uncharacterized protein with PIN domain
METLELNYNASLPMKKCFRCKEFRLLTDYCNNKYGIDRLFWVCNHCKKDYYNSSHIKPIKYECGRIINKNYLQKHLNSNIHKKYLNFNLKNNNES